MLRRSATLWRFIHGLPTQRKVLPRGNAWLAPVKVRSALMVLTMGMLDPANQPWCHQPRFGIGRDVIHSEMRAVPSPTIRAAALTEPEMMPTLAG